MDSLSLQRFALGLLFSWCWQWESSVGEGADEPQTRETPNSYLQPMRIFLSKLEKLVSAISKPPTNGASAPSFHGCKTRQTSFWGHQAFPGSLGSIFGQEWDTRRLILGNWPSRQVCIHGVKSKTHTLTASVAWPSLREEFSDLQAQVPQSRTTCSSSSGYLWRRILGLLSHSVNIQMAPD